MTYRNLFSLRVVRLQWMEFLAGLFLQVCRMVGILMIGSNLAGHARLFSQIKDQLRVVVDGPVIVLSSTDVINLQTLQKKIVSGCLQVELADEEEGELTTKVHFY